MIIMISNNMRQDFTPLVLYHSTSTMLHELLSMMVVIISFGETFHIAANNNLVLNILRKKNNGCDYYEVVEVS